MADTETATARENLITKATEFLQHPKVQSSSLAQRRSFLVKKGLTDDEVEIAIQRSGVMDSEAGPPVPAVPVAPPPRTVLALQHAPPGTLWTRVKDVTFVCVFIGGVGYGFYQVLKKYVLPIWLGPSKEEEQIAALKKTIADLENNVRALVDNMRQLQTSMGRQEESVKSVIKQAAHNRGPEAHQSIKDSTGLREIKQELTSLKGLLLSRNQFPKTPRTQPVVPSWQLASETEPKQADLIPEQNKVVTVAEINTLTAQTDHADLSAETDLSTEADVSEHTDLSTHDELSRHADINTHADLSTNADVSAHADVTTHADCSLNADLSADTEVSVHADLSLETDASGSVCAAEEADGCLADADGKAADSTHELANCDSSETELATKSSSFEVLDVDADSSDSVPDVIECCESSPDLVCVAATDAAVSERAEGGEAGTEVSGEDTVEMPATLNGTEAAVSVAGDTQEDAVEAACVASSEEEGGVNGHASEDAEEELAKKSCSFELIEASGSPEPSTEDVTSSPPTTEFISTDVGQT